MNTNWIEKPKSLGGAKKYKKILRKEEVLQFQKLWDDIC
jgi:hypothetical protein